MAERTVKVTLIAQATGLIQGLDQASKKVRETGSEIEKLAQKKAAFEDVGRVALGFGLAAAAGVALAVSKFADFDQAMSNVQASTHESAANMSLLQNAALEAGSATVFSATESANAIDELAKAGISTGDIIGGALVGSLNLASAGGLGVARAAEISATALQQFGLKGSDASHVADVLAAGAGKAMGSVDDLANALKFVGPVAASMGVSIEETAGTLSLFAQQGIIGEQAGTSLRGVLSSLTAPSAQASTEIKKLGINLYDSQGKFLGIQNAAGELSRAYVDMDDKSRQASLGVIFGRETITAATALYKAGAEGVQEWTDKVNDSGYAAETARLKLDNLSGDIEKLGGAIDTGLIKSGSAANDVLRVLTQLVTAAVDEFASLPEPLLGAGLGVMALVAGVSLVSGGFFTLVPKIAEFNSSLGELGPKAQTAAKGILAVGKATAGIAIFATAVALIKTWQDAVEDAAVSSEELQNALATTSDAAGLFNKTLTNTGSTVFPSYAPFVKDLGEVKDRLSDIESYGTDIFSWIPRTMDANATKVQDFTDGWTKLGKEMANLVNSGNVGAVSSKLIDLQKSAKLTDDEMYQLIALSPELLAAFTNQATAAGLAADKQTILGLALSESAPATADNTEKLAELSGMATDASMDIDALAESIRNFGAAQLDTNSAQREFEESIDAVTATLTAQQEAYVTANGSLDGWSASLDIGTEAGRENQANLDGIAQSALNAAGAIITQTGSQEQATVAVQRGRDELILALAQYGITGAAADAYADSLGLIPGNVSTAVSLTGISEADSQVSSFVSRWDGSHVNIIVDAVGSGVPALVAGNGTGKIAYENGGMSVNGVQAFASGGFPAGIYNGRSGGIHKFAEENVGWEAYISGKPGQERRNAGIALEALDRLGIPAPQPAPMGRYSAAPMSYATASGGGVTLSPTVSLAGATLVMSVDGRQMTAVIDEQIVRAQSADSNALNRGYGTDY